MDFFYTLGKLRISNRVSREAAFKLIYINLIIRTPKPVFTSHQKALISNEGHENFVISSHGGISNLLMSVNEIFGNNTPPQNLSQELH